MPRFLRNHIVVNDRTEVLPYTSPNTGRSKVVPRPIGNRQQHGTSIREQFDTAVEGFRAEHDGDSLYIVFKSPLDVLLDIDKFDKGNFRLASYKRLTANDSLGRLHNYYEATVCLNRRAVAQFLTKVEQYLNRDTPLAYNIDGTIRRGGNPLNQTLIANIEEIRSATLQSFWQEPELPFPDIHESVWWEVWLSRDDDDSSLSPINDFLARLQTQVYKLAKEF